MSDLFLGAFMYRSPKPRITRHKNIVDITKIVRKRPITKEEDLQRVVLIDIVETSFACSEETRFKRYINAFKKHGYIFKPNHTVAMVSKSRKIIDFFVAESKINYTAILDTRRWRLSKDHNEVWDDDNIVYYAAQCGFQLIVPSRQTISDVMYALEAQAA